MSGLSRRQWVFGGAAALAAAGFAAMRLGFLQEPQMGVDSAAYMAIGDILNRGGRLYADVWDQKPPGLYLFYQLIMDLWPTARAAIVASLAAMGLNVLLLFGLTRKLLGPWAGLSAGWLLAVFTAVFWASAPNAEVFLLTLQLAALWLWLREPGTVPSGGRILLGGAALGVAFMVKYVVLLPAVGLAAWLVWAGGRDSRPGARRRLGLFAAGWAAGAAPFALYCLWQGVWGDFVAGTFGYNSGYVFRNAWEYFQQYGLGFITGYFRQHWALWVGAAAGLAVWFWRRPPATRSGAGDGSGLMLLWLLSSVAAVLAPLKFLDHYFLLVVPGLCFWTAYPLREGTPLGRLPRAVAAVALLAVSLPLAAIRTGESLDRWRHPGPDPAGDGYAPSAIGRYVESETTAADRIYVWRSLETDIYFYAHRRPASRIFFWPHLVREPAPPGGLAGVEAEFRAHPPAFLVVGDSPVYAERTLPFLDRMLARDYSLDRVVEGNKIYRRKAPALREPGAGE